MIRREYCYFALSVTLILFLLFLSHITVLHLVYLVDIYVAMYSRMKIARNEGVETQKRIKAKIIK